MSKKQKLYKVDKEMTQLGVLGGEHSWFYVVAPSIDAVASNHPDTKKIEEVSREVEMIRDET